MNECSYMPRGGELIENMPFGQYTGSESCGSTNNILFKGTVASQRYDAVSTRIRDLRKWYPILLPTESDKRGVLGLGVFLLQHFPLVNI